jgi:mRNA-degrading endonuclease RelE of RelBE toxin-antitoxin system
VFAAFLRPIRKQRAQPPQLRVSRCRSSGHVKRLTGRPGARLRIGDRRVIFVETTATIEVRAVGNRRDIYK